MNEKLKKLRLCDVNCLEIATPYRSRSRMERLISVLGKRGQLESFVDGIVSPRLLIAKNKFFFFDLYLFFEALSRHHPFIEVEFGLIPTPRKETLTSLKARVVRQIQTESLLSPDAVEVFSFEKANSGEKIFRRCEYATVIGRKANSLNVYDRQYKTRKLQHTPTFTDSTCDIEEALVHVSDLPAKQGRGAKEDND